MYESSETRARYLALALTSRKVLRSLDQYLKSGKEDSQLESVVKQLIDSLQGSREENNLFGPAPNDSPFTNYEQLMTLEEVQADMKDQDILKNLSNLISAQGDDASRKRDAADAIKFFYILENRALHHYSRQVGSRES
jgi:hypothetical protein